MDQIIKKLQDSKRALDQLLTIAYAINDTDGAINKYLDKAAIKQDARDKIAAVIAELQSINIP